MVQELWFVDPSASLPKGLSEELLIVLLRGEMGR